MSINTKYNMLFLLLSTLLCFLCFFLLHPLGCSNFHLQFHLLFMLEWSKESLITSFLLHFVHQCGLLEVELPFISGVCWNYSTKCCQFYWIPPFPRVGLHLRSMSSWKKMMCGLCWRSICRGRLFALGGVLTTFHALILQ